MPSLKKIVAIVVSSLVLAYVGAGALIYAYQAHMIFVPQAKVEHNPGEFGAHYEAVAIPVRADDGTAAKLAAWWGEGEAKAAHPDRVKVLLYLHGNYGNIGANAEHSARLSTYGVNVLLPDYRGFGESSGPFPSESHVYEDAEAAWRWLLSEKHYAPSEIVIYGHSLGGAIAIQLASRHPDAAGVIVESSFTSVVEMARLNSRFRVLPMDWLVTQHFDSIGRVGALKMPVLFIHGSEDRVVPTSMATRLYDHAPDPKALVFIAGGGHDNCAVVGREQYTAAVKEFLERLQ